MVWLRLSKVVFVDRVGFYRTANLSSKFCGYCNSSQSLKHLLG